MIDMVMDTQGEVRDDMNDMYENEILPRLRFNTLQQTCKRVCKTWLNWIKNPSFTDSHLENSIQNHRLNVVFFNPTTNSVGSFDGDTFRPSTKLHSFNVRGNYSILGSCNGLLCFRSNDADEHSEPNFIIFNPATTIERSYLVECPIYNRAYGFGCTWDDVNKWRDYKLVFIQGTEIHVYSLKSSSMKRVRDCSYQCAMSRLLPIGVATSNVVHWLYDYINKFEGVYSLDLASETQFETPLPSYIKGRPRLMSLRGRLYVVSVAYSIHARSWVEVNVCVMKHYGCCHDSWVHLFEVQLDNITFSAIPISLKEGGRKVLFELWHQQLRQNKKSYVWYDLITKERHGHELPETPSDLIAHPCLDTLVNPRFLQEV